MKAEQNVHRLLKQLQHIEFPSYFVNIFCRVVTISDPTVAAELAKLFSSASILAQEVMLTDAPFYPAYYIQKNICDFGLKAI